MKRLYLHIGTPKTGTTTIQKFLNINRLKLKSLGMCYPTSLGKNFQTLLAPLISENENFTNFYRKRNLQNINDQKNAKQSWLTDFEREVSVSTEQTWIMSSEHLTGKIIHRSEVEQLYILLSKYFIEIKPIIYLRSPIEHAVSLINTNVISGNYDCELLSPDSSILQRKLHYENIVSMWSEVFEKKIKVRLFPSHNLAQNALLIDFAEVCDFEIDEEFQVPSAQNESVSYLGLKLLAEANKFLPAFLEDQVNEDRNGFVPFFRQYFSEGKKYSPTLEEIASFDEAFKHSNEWIRENYFPDRKVLFDQPNFDEGTSINLSPGEITTIAKAIVDLWLK